MLIACLISRNLWHKKTVKAVKRKKVTKSLIKKVVIEYYKTNILTYCLVCKRNAENKDVKMVKTKNGRLMLSSNLSSKRLLSNLGIKAPLSGIPLLGDLLF